MSCWAGTFAQSGRSSGPFGYVGAGRTEKASGAASRIRGVDRPADEARGTDDTAAVTQLAQHDRQAAGGQRQGPAVGDAADLGEQRVAEGGHASADDDETGV